MYAQYSYNTEAYIIANKDGLIALRDAIDKAIAKSEPKKFVSTCARVKANDGEPYSVVVICNETPWGVDDSWALHGHYNAEHASTEQTSGLKWPADLLTDVEYKKYTVPAAEYDISPQKSRDKRWTLEPIPPGQTIRLTPEEHVQLLKNSNAR